MTDKKLKAFREFHQCWSCRLVNEMQFHRVYTPAPAHWQGECPNCDALNYIARPDWDEEADRGNDTLVPA